MDSKKRQLSVLVTAGGTIEDIDTVRGITNHATGRLGSIIANIFIKSGAKVTYLCGEQALRPGFLAEELLTVRGAADLARTLEELLRRRRFDCVIHSMAVGDFTPSAVISVDELAQTLESQLLAENISQEKISGLVRDILLKGRENPPEKKISSKTSGLMVILKQTPKAIALIKSIQPRTLLVGFKLLSGAAEEELLSAAREQIEQHGCDLVLANDLSGISGQEHKALLMDKHAVLAAADTKLEIAKMIFERVTERIEK